MDMPAFIHKMSGEVGRTALPQYSLYPLSALGLCDAVTMMPAAALYRWMP